MISRPIKPQWFQILLALSKGDLHGIGIQSQVLRRTDGHMRLWPAMLYRSLDTLEEAGLVQRTHQPAGSPDDQRRQYYTLSSAGRRRLAEEAEVMSRWASEAREAGAT